MSDQTRTHSYLYDLFVVPWWRDRFDQLFLDSVERPAEGRILLTECGTGGLAIELASNLGDAGSVVATDADETLLDLARGKATTAKVENIRFVSATNVAREVKSNFFDMAIGDASLLPTSRIEPMLRELRQAVTPDGKVVLYVVLRGSFGELFSILWEALYECGLAESLQGQLESVVMNAHPTVEEINDLAREAGLNNVRLVGDNENFSYGSGEEFLTSPLIAEFWLDRWLAFVPPAKVGAVKEAIKRIIDRDCEGQSFDLTVKAVLVTGDRRPETGSAADDDSDEDEPVEPDEDGETEWRN